MKPPYAEFDAPRLPRPIHVDLPSKGAIADALGIDATEIGFENHVPCRFEAGVPFAFVPVAGLDVNYTHSFLTTMAITYCDTILVGLDTSCPGREN